MRAAHHQHMMSASRQQLPPTRHHLVRTCFHKSAISLRIAIATWSFLRFSFIFAMRRAQKETVFGADLSTLGQDESTECPNIVLKLVTELLLSVRAQELQHLYSVKPSVVEVDALCQEIDSVAASNLRLDKYSSSVVDEALKRVFQRAKQPIIPLVVAAAIDRCGDGLNSAFANQQLAIMPKVRFNLVIKHRSLCNLPLSVQFHSLGVLAQVFACHL